MTELDERTDTGLTLPSELTCQISFHPDHYACGERATHQLIIFDTVCQRDLESPVCVPHAALGVEAARTGGWCDCGGHGGHVSINIRLLRL